MSQKIIEVEGVGPVVLAKRRGTRSLRLTVRPDGKVRVGMPVWAPYSAGADFALRRRGWIKQHLADVRQPVLIDGQRIGKSYRLNFASLPPVKPTRTRIAANLITVSSPHHHSSPQVQQAAQIACERALKKEADSLLRQRLSLLARDNGFSYQEIRIKRLTSRWGSCSDKKTIALNYFLIQLPWHLIDYVIIHELVHTVHLNHSPQFWQAVEKIQPNAKQLRREVRQFRPVLIPA